MEKGKQGGPGRQVGTLSEAGRAWLRKQEVPEEDIEEIDRTRRLLSVRIIGGKRKLPLNVYPAEKVMFVAYDKCGRDIGVLKNIAAWARERLDPATVRNPGNFLLAAVNKQLADSREEK